MSEARLSIYFIDPIRIQFTVNVYFAHQQQKSLRKFLNFS